MIRSIQVFRPVVGAFLLGALVKGLLIAVAEQSASARLIGWLLVDPAVPLIATPLTAAFFGQRAIVPGPQESFVFNLLLAIGFGLECAVLALIGSLFVAVRRRELSLLGR